MTDSVAEPHGKTTAELVQEANNGDTVAMSRMGMDLLKGVQSTCIKTHTSVYTEAFVWFNKARVAGDVRGQAHAGWLLLMGQGVPRDTKRGLVWLTVAAMRGSDVTWRPTGWPVPFSTATTA